MIKKIIIILVVVLAIIAAWYFLLYLPNQNNIPDGTPCKVNLFPGTIKNGVCIGTPATEVELPTGILVHLK